MDESDLPYKAEYAKSNRSSCKQCKGQIEKDTLRLGIMVQSPRFDGKVPMWYHFKCFFMKTKLKTTGDIAHFTSLRWEDQKRLQEKVGATPVPDKGKKSKSSDGVKEFSVEYAKSNRSICKVCSEKITKNDIRISKLDFESDTARRFGPVPGWHHLDCFVRMKSSLEFTESADNLPGFSSLSAEDQATLKEKIKSVAGKRKVDSEEKPEKKIKKEVSDEEEKILKSQNKLFYGIRDVLKKNLQKKEMVELLELNDQAIPTGESAVLDNLADRLAFGVLSDCPECKEKLQLGSDGYKCSGYLTGWTKCQFVTKTPERRKVEIPEDFKDKYDFFQKYKYKERVRMFQCNPDTLSQQPSTSNSGSSQTLQHFKIVLLVESEEKEAELQKKISKLGGKVVKKVDKNTTCIITTKDMTDKNGSKIRSAKKNNIFLVSEDFLDAVKDEGRAAYLIKEHLILPCGGDLGDRLSQQDSGFITKSKDTKSAGKIQKVVVSGVAAVDPDSGKEGSATVLEKNGEVYNAVLGQVDITKGKNSYYKIQVLVGKYPQKYHVFRSWGRVGTTIGGNKLEDCDTCADAVHKFKELYFEKTGNEWSNRDNFVKQPKCFYPLEIDYGQEDVGQLKAGSTSKLAKPVQELICLIFDVEAMKKAMLEFELDLQKMPLGKLSKKHIQKAYCVLTELQQLLQGEKLPTKILDASNRFYTLIPHDFGLKKPPMLDNEDLLKSKTEMLDSLLEIEFAYKLLKVEDSEEKDAVDQHYEQLKTDIEILDKDSKEFKQMKTYLTNTHAATHNQYSLELEEVFKINRHGELDTYKSKVKDLNNKKLLWHGSRTTNFAGILSQGLRIAPPEAPSTGYMFGKGIYFADMVSKSANYCYANRQNSTGILLLCEVALGNMYERINADFIEKLPKDKHSTKGIGKTFPDPKESVFVDEVEIPCGKPVSAGVKGSTLLYNEYIVYDVNQVNIKYLLKVNFNWNW